jgi:phage protein D
MSKTRSFESKCIYNIVETIANDHDLVPKISQEYRTYFSDKKVLQIKKSDLTMLCELAERYGAFYRICGTTLVFIKKGDGKKANGVDREIIDVRVKDATAWSLKIKGRSKYNQVIASYVDTKTGKVEKIEVKRQEKAQQRQRRKIGTVVIGPEEIERREEKQGPPLKISLPVSTREEAEKRARSLLNSKNFENETLSISLDASPYIYAEAVINLTGFRERVDGMWIVTKVSHTIDVNEFKTDIDCQKFLEDIS